MIGDFALQSVAAHEQKIYRRAICARMDSKPLSDTDFPTTNPLVRFTDFRYTLKFEPSTAGKGKPYIIKADVLVLGKIRIKDEEDLKRIAKENSAVAWLIRWTNVLDLFDIALLCYKTDLQLSFDIKKYSDYIKSIAPNQAGQDYVVFYVPRIAKAREEYIKEIYKSHYNKRREILTKKLEENR